LCEIIGEPVASQEGVPLQPPEEAAREFFGDENEQPKRKARTLKNKTRKKDK
jgi:hypothetical protein